MNFGPVLTTRVLNRSLCSWFKSMGELSSYRYGTGQPLCGETVDGEMSVTENLKLTCRDMRRMRQLGYP